MSKKFSVTVSKSLEYEIPVEAENEKQARELVQALLDKGDYDFIFGWETANEFEYEAECACACSDKTFNELAADFEVVHEDGTHD